MTDDHQEDADDDVVGYSGSATAGDARDRAAADARSGAFYTVLAVITLGLIVRTKKRK